MNRRDLIAAAAAIGASPLWARSRRAASAAHDERRDLFPQGVASGDPDHESVTLWTRRPPADDAVEQLRCEVATDPTFDTTVAARRVNLSPLADWTCRVLVGGLRPATTYWYRFADGDGRCSRVGRTSTAPLPTDGRPASFAFVSCQSVNEGVQTAFRRMIHDDDRKAPEHRIGFVLHLGDFIYEVVQYPDETPTRLGRTVFDIGRVPDARKVGRFHVPTTLEGYRTIYRAHLADQDIQDARARFPFVCIGDNHEFSWQGWQSFVKFDGKVEPAQRLRVAANQAWWEYIPARVRKASGASLGSFAPPVVRDAPVTSLDPSGLGDEPNNIAAIGSMTAYRAHRWGRHVELLITDLHSYAMADPTDDPALDVPGFPYLCPQEVVEILDAGREYAGGRPPASIRIGDTTIVNSRRDGPAFTALGSVQKAWLKKRLSGSDATWKVWAATNATLDMRADPQNLPSGVGARWPGAGYATFGGGDFSAAMAERAELYDHVRDDAIEGFAIVSGDRHSFWAGYAAKALPPREFEPVGVAFVCGSISAPGLAEATEHGLKGQPLRPLFVADAPQGPRPAINVLVQHGVRSALEFSRSGDMEAARALRNPDLAPHVEFVDMSGHGYSIVTATEENLATESVCIPRPIAPTTAADGGPIRYRVMHTVGRWRAGDRPRLTQKVLEGDPYPSA